MDNYNPNNFTERSGMATASLVTGIFSIILAYFTGFLGVILGIVAILLGIFSKGNAPVRSGKSIGGIITGAIGLVFGIIIIAAAIFLITKTDFMAEFMKELEGYQTYLDNAR